jgi:hypothetical protein
MPLSEPNFLPPPLLADAAEAAEPLVDATLGPLAPPFASALSQRREPAPKARTLTAATAAAFGHRFTCLIVIHSCFAAAGEIHAGRGDVGPLLNRGATTPEHGTLQAAQIAVLLLDHNNLKDNGKYIAGAFWYYYCRY